MEPAVVVSGGMTPGGDVGLLAGHATALLAEFGHPVALVEPCALPAVALLAADRRDPAIDAALADLSAAAGMVVVAPVNRAAHCGMVKSVLDLLPRGALAGRPILPVTTGGRQGRGAVEFCVAPLLRELGATRVLRGPFVPASDLTVGVPGRVTDALAEFSIALGRRRRLAG
ncbi:NAD(P)H-dependent oxidoreductase [Actinokineospora sp. NPDC004072]